MSDVLFYTLAFAAMAIMFAIVVFYDPKPKSKSGNP
jgi:hypothetical protein